MELKDGDLRSRVSSDCIVKLTFIRDFWKQWKFFQFYVQPVFRGYKISDTIKKKTDSGVLMGAAQTLLETNYPG